VYAETGQAQARSRWPGLCFAPSPPKGGLTMPNMLSIQEFASKGVVIRADAE